ncbi:flagellar basal body-associated protein FliL [Paraburkholderia sp.]|uniref:flagellar basal body-associated protein FliL n=1 Tax=Paraburkholderia sp. TaxID=1926495 RepID=UPI002393011B|nr:flagellar basal body-associated protein FliL [Paraburkholderia sp.]MDE1181218.1 flagellar basal body-associated protein FliL [Paraburkholderia sp.]
MASTTANQAADKPASPGPMKRIIIIALIAIVAAGAAGAGVWFFMSRHHTAGPVEAPPPPPPVFFALDPMTVNLLSDDGQQHYLRVGLTLKLADAKAQDDLTVHMPEIRSRMLLALSNKHPEDLATLDGKTALANELKALIDNPAAPEGASGPVAAPAAAAGKADAKSAVQDVLFTEFVVQ